MPTYSYTCTKCGHEFDLFHSISDESAKHCEKCGAVAERRIAGGVGVIFKGSGFYVTDYRNGKDKVNGGLGSNGHSHSSSHDEKKAEAVSKVETNEKKSGSEKIASKD